MTNRMNANCAMTSAANFAVATFPCTNMNTTMILDAAFAASIFVALMTLLALVSVMSLISLLGLINLLGLISLLGLLAILRIPERLKR